MAPGCQCELMGREHTCERFQHGVLFQDQARLGHGIRPNAEGFPEKRLEGGSDIFFLPAPPLLAFVKGNLGEDRIPLLQASERLDKRLRLIAECIGDSCEVRCIGFYARSARQCQIEALN